MAPSDSDQPVTQMSKADFEERLPRLRVDLLNAQEDLKRADFGVLIVVAGDDWVGVHGVLNRLNEWLDARLMPTYVFRQPTEEERLRPFYWRYWRRIPPVGRIAVFGGASAQRIVADRAGGVGDSEGEVSAEEAEKTFRQRIADTVRFERDLVADGTLVLRFWVTVPPELHEERLVALPKEVRRILAWRVGTDDWSAFDRSGSGGDAARSTARRYLSATASAVSPWHVVDGTQARYRDYTIGRTIADALVDHLAERAEQVASRQTAAGAEGPGAVRPAFPRALEGVDLSSSLSKEEYRERLSQAQRRLQKVTARAYTAGVSSVLVFEGWDAAGKGGAIRRITSQMEAGTYEVVPIAAPSPEEKARHYLWRFWRHLPAAGKHMLIFDRSWYGRVLVERVEGFARPDEWERAFDEIRDFEQQIIRHGVPVLKFWLHIDADEQLRRFTERERTAFKKYKITDEDYRNREKWDAYVEAVDELVARTSTDQAPWHVVPANDKRTARVVVAETVVSALKRAVTARG